MTATCTGKTVKFARRLWIFHLASFSIYTEMKKLLYAQNIKGYSGGLMNSDLD